MQMGERGIGICVEGRGEGGRESWSAEVGLGLEVRGITGLGWAAGEIRGWAGRRFTERSELLEGTLPSAVWVPAARVKG